MSRRQVRRVLVAVLSILGGVPPADLRPQTVRRLAAVFALLCALATVAFFVALVLYLAS